MRYSTTGPNRDPALRTHYVYRLFDADGRLMYVGCSIHPYQRIKEHRQFLAPMVERIAKVRMQGPYNYQTAREIEREAIHAEGPLMNSNAPGGGARKARMRDLWREHFAELTAQGVAHSEAASRASHHAKLVILRAVAA